MRDKKKAVAIDSFPHLSRAEEARAQIKAASQTFHHMAATAHSEGMFFEGQSARLEMLVEGVEDDEIIQIRDSFVEGGVLEYLDIDTLEGLATPTNASGGDA